MHHGQGGGTAKELQVPLPEGEGERAQQLGQNVNAGDSGQVGHLPFCLFSILLVVFG